MYCAGNFASYFLWHEITSHVLKKKTLTEGVRRQGAEEKFWTKSGRSNVMLQCTGENYVLSVIFNPHKIHLES
jgi:hypothetical protein